MHTEEIREQVKVGAVFDNNRISPKWFVWKDRKYQVKEINYTWQSRQGEARMLHFSVTDGSTLFEICLNMKTLLWFLEKVGLN